MSPQMIEPTDEMTAAFWAGSQWPKPGDLDVRRGLAAVLAIVERDQAPTQFAYDAAVRALEKHRARAARAEALLADLVNADPCWFDHHGHCRTHGWTATESTCPHGRAKVLLGPEPS